MKRGEGAGWVQPRPGSQQVQGRARSTFLSAHLPESLPQGTHRLSIPCFPSSSPGPAQVHPKQAHLAHLQRPQERTSEPGPREQFLLHSVSAP